MLAMLMISCLPSLLYYSREPIAYSSIISHNSMILEYYPRRLPETPSPTCLWQTNLQWPPHPLDEPFAASQFDACNGFLATSILRSATSWFPVLRALFPPTSEKRPQPWGHLQRAWNSERLVCSFLSRRKLPGHGQESRAMTHDNQSWPESWQYQCHYWVWYQYSPVSTVASVNQCRWVVSQ